MASRYGSLAGPSSAVRKSKMESKMSLLPKPRPTFSIDRSSIDAKQPSGVNYRSSSAEPRGGLSREASATKIPVNRRSRSQTGGNEVKYDKTTPLHSGKYSKNFNTPNKARFQIGVNEVKYDKTTPMRSSQYSRNTNTPSRTPSKERGSIDLQSSLDRVMAFITVKDQRSINNIGWQRAECARVNDALTIHSLGVLNRPLTIARFVEIVNGLITLILRDPKLNNDTYVTKLPHIVKRLLYPGVVSKSWLRSVNTLHAFPHALALITYLVDLLNDLKQPISEEWLFINNDGVSCLRRKHFIESWNLFNLNKKEEIKEHIKPYIEKFKELVGFDEQKVIEQEKVNKKYRALLEESEAEDSAHKEKEEALLSRHDLIRSEIKAVKNERQNLAEQMTAERTRAGHLDDTKKKLAAEIETLKPQQVQLKNELAVQTMSVQQRDGLLDKIDFNRRVVDTKRALAEDISKKLINKENELALRQKRALESCAQYKQALVQLNPVCPHLASLAVDEAEVMTEQCLKQMTSALDVLQRERDVLAQQKSQRARTKTQLHRRNAQLAEETRSKIADLFTSIKREQLLLKEEMSSDTLSAAAWCREEAEMQQRCEELRVKLMKYREGEDQLAKLQERHKQLKERVVHLKSKAETAKAQADEAQERSIKRHQQLLREAIHKIKDRINSDLH